MSAGRAGIVLAGGLSRRFGDGDKALASVDGTPMFVRVLERLGQVVEQVVVSCRDDQRPAFERALEEGAPDVPVEFAVDPVPDRGPLAGARAALDYIDADYVAVVGCDMPGVDPSFLDFLFDRAHGRDAAVPLLPDGRPHLTQAVYRADALGAAADEVLAADRRSLWGALELLDAAEVPPEEVERQTSWRSLRDLNTREELAAFERERETE